MVECGYLSAGKTIIMIKSETSTIVSMAVLVAQTLEGAGVDPEPVFAEAGLEMSAPRDPNLRIPSSQFLRLLGLAEAASGDPTFGLKLSRFAHPTSFLSLGIAMFSCDTLREYLERYVKYYRVITSNDALEADEDESRYRLRYTPGSHIEFSPLRVDGAVSLSLFSMRSAVEAELNPKLVQLARPLPEGYEEEYTDYFQCPVEFDAEFTEIHMAPADLDIKLPTANPELRELYDSLTLAYLDKMDRADFPGRVRKELIKLLPIGVSGKEQVARALFMSTRTLYNKLESSGTTFREVLDETRRDLAEGYIGQNLPIYEISYLTAFSDTANFSRAFKKWTGKSPMEYRDSLLA